MSKSEYEKVKKLLESKRKEIKNNQTEARSVLVRAGIFTEKGTLKKVYKDICKDFKHKEHQCYYIQVVLKYTT